jgi:predicted amidohydrolase YtcJ
LSAGFSTVASLYSYVHELPTFTLFDFEPMNNRPLLVGVAIAIALLLVAILLIIVRPSREVDVVIVNGIVHTVNGREPLAEAIAIDKGVIVAVGSTKDIDRAYAGRRREDLKGMAVYPGFIDSHAHLESLGYALNHLDVSGTTAVSDIQAKVAEEVTKRKLGVWIRGRGWDQNLWQSKQFPTRQSLDAVAPGNPVVLTRIDGHAVWVNSAVLRVAGITSATKDPEGGKILRDRSGAPTGVFVDNAIDMLAAILPPPTEEERISSIARAVQECVQHGITGVQDMGVDSGGIALYSRLIREGAFPLRVYAAIEGKDLWERYLKTGPDTGGHDGRLTVRALKLYADGALGSRGAAMIEPYSDDPGNRGLTLTSAGELRDAAAQALSHGFQVCVHAIGDRGNHLVLDVYEEVLKGRTGSGNDPRFRIEHAQVLDSEDVPRFHALGVLPSMQPTHCTSDMPWAEDRLGPKRVRWAYAWRALLDAGSIIPAGSDFPVERPGPIMGFYAAITRQDRDGNPPGGWHPEQRMTREEALKAFTIWGAYAEFQESTLGSIEPGKRADLVVLSDDMMTIDPSRIPSTRVVETLVDGRVVFSGETPALAR